MSDTAPNFSWGHINVNVSDLDASIAFYEKLGFSIFLPGIPYLGLSLDPEPQALSDASAKALGVDSGTKGRACILQLDDGFPKLDLTEFSSEGSGTPLTNADTGLVRICLVTEDLAGDVAKLKAAGVAFVDDPQTGHAKLAEVAVCKDPDGTLIELLQVHMERWAPFLGG